MFREWAAINHFSDNDLEIDEKTKALQRSISRFEKTYYGISILYWSLWLAALLSGNALLTKISSFSVFCWAMLASSFSFSAYFLARMIKAVGRPHDLVAALQTDMSGLNRYSWRTCVVLISTDDAESRAQALTRSRAHSVPVCTPGCSGWVSRCSTSRRRRPGLPATSGRVGS